MLWIRSALAISLSLMVLPSVKAQDPAPLGGASFEFIDSMRVESSSVISRLGDLPEPDDGLRAAGITFGSADALTGISISIQADPQLTVVDVASSFADIQTTFENLAILADGATLDLAFVTPVGPFATATDGVEIAQTTLATVTFLPAIVEPNDPPISAFLRLVDGVSGSAITNAFSTASGVAVPSTTDGEITILPRRPRLETAFRLGGVTGATTVDESSFPQAEGAQGGRTEIGIYYAQRKSAVDPFSGPIPESLQGFTFVIVVPEELEYVEGSLSLPLLSSLPTEFTVVQRDPLVRPVAIPLEAADVPVDPMNSPNTVTRPGVDLAISLLIDAIPPFDEQVAPSPASGDEWLLAAALTFDVAEDAVPADPGTGLIPEEGTLPIGFVLEPTQLDDDEPLSPIVENLTLAFFRSSGDLRLVPSNVLVRTGPEFRRGDCNDDGSLDIADAISVLQTIIAVLGSSNAVAPDCVAACDADGVSPPGALQPVTINDALTILVTAFGLTNISGISPGQSAIPPTVGQCGRFPSQTLADCESFTSCP